MVTETMPETDEIGGPEEDRDGGTQAAPEPPPSRAVEFVAAYLNHTASRRSNGPNYTFKFEVPIFATEVINLLEDGLLVTFIPEAKPDAPIKLGEGAERPTYTSSRDPEGAYHLKITLRLSKQDRIRFAGAAGRMAQLMEDDTVLGRIRFEAMQTGLGL